MLNKVITTGVFVFISCFSLSAQSKDNNEKPEELPNAVVVDSIVKTKKTINPLSPAKAAFYSAILPGLGQAYNKKYWKIPIIYAALGTEIYIYNQNNKEYKRYRDAYKSRLAGFKNDEFYLDAQGNALSEPRITLEGLERAQKLFRKNKEVTILFIAGTYVLNIIWANVTAHLLQYNIDKNLSLAPHYKINKTDATSNFGLTLNFKF